jgi:hypothetical protein
VPAREKDIIDGNDRIRRFERLHARGGTES